ncbi:MAG TPA: tetratricopeptide repeat protein [Acidobacteriota bacterium]|jgi:tetratricopeptide (TPR) repeat protein|nr:tetratricopeptide repeat protein [Acidobacteriota bacterium]
MYTPKEAAKILNVQESKIRYWSRIGLIKPSVRTAGRKLYNFQDLLCLRTAKALVENGYAPHRIKMCLRNLQSFFPEGDHRLHALKIFGDGKKLIVDVEGRLVDSNTGQQILQFHVDRAMRDLRNKIRDIAGRAEDAQYWFDKGTYLDSDAETYQEAIHSYETSIRLDGSLPHAYVNLGNVYYNMGQTRRAEELYRQALQRDQDHPQAHYNLGNVLEEHGSMQEAIYHWKRAFELDPKFPDPLFNLGLIYQKMNMRKEARVYWKKYLQLDPNSPWADMARNQLKNLQ